MKKYYYVRMLNEMHYRSDNGNYLPTETSKIINNYVRNVSLGYSQPTALAVLCVRSTNITTREKGFSDGKHNLDNPIFVICEDNGEYLEEVVTGNRYEKGPNYTNMEVCCDKLKLSIVREIPVSEVAEMLRNLSEYELDKYALVIHQLDRAISNGYYKDKKRLADKETQNQTDDSYIKSFRKKYGK